MRAKQQQIKIASVRYVCTDHKICLCKLTAHSCRFGFSTPKGICEGKTKFSEAVSWREQTQRPTLEAAWALNNPGALSVPDVGG